MRKGYNFICNVYINIFYQDLLHTYKKFAKKLDIICKKILPGSMMKICTFTPYKQYL